MGNGAEVPLKDIHYIEQRMCEYAPIESADFRIDFPLSMPLTLLTIHGIRYVACCLVPSFHTAWFVPSAARKSCTLEGESAAYDNRPNQSSVKIMCERTTATC